MCLLFLKASRPPEGCWSLRRAACSSSCRRDVENTTRPRLSLMAAAALALSFCLLAQMTGGDKPDGPPLVWRGLLMPAS